MSIQSLGSSSYVSTNSHLSIADSDSDSDSISIWDDESTDSSSGSDSDSSSQVSWEKIKKQKNKFILDATKKLTPAVQDIVESGISSAGVLTTHKTKQWAHKKFPTVAHGVLDSSIDKTGKSIQIGLNKVAKSSIPSASNNSAQITIKSTDQSIDKSAKKQNGSQGN